jgi:hypothetical protein
MRPAPSCRIFRANPKIVVTLGAQALNALKSIERNRLMLRATDSNTLFSQTGKNEFDEVLTYVSEKYAKNSDSDLKRIVYLTAPMRQILRKEKGLGQNMFNRAIDFSVIDTAV